MLFSSKQKGKATRVMGIANLLSVTDRRPLGNRFPRGLSRRSVTEKHIPPFSLTI